AIPDKILTVPIIAAFVVSVVHFIAVYRLRVAVSLSQAIGAMFAAMSVQWTVARAVGDGLIKRSLPFVRTAKGAGKVRARAREFQAFWETIIGVALLIGAAILLATNRQQIREIYIFAVVLVLQSLPFLSALTIAALESSRINDFAYWRRIEARLAEFLPRRAFLPKAPAAADKRIEPLP